MFSPSQAMYTVPSSINQRVMVHPLVTLNKSETFFSPTGQR